MSAPQFYWGVGIENCWMAEHNEQNRAPKRLLDVYLQMQHYTMWREDLDKAAGLGVRVLRYGVPWYKANPQPGVYDWSWIGKSLDYLVNTLRIIPVIDLIHYGTPLWMENGVLNSEYPQRIAEYAAAFARQFKGLVNHYTPHNEPQLSAVLGGLQACWPPYLVGIDGWCQVGINVARGMVFTSEALRAELPEAILVSADCLASPATRLVKDQLAVRVDEEERADFDYLVKTFPAGVAYGKVSPDGAFAKVLRHARATEDELLWFCEHAQLPDIVGHNYYPNCFDGPGSPIEEGLATGMAELKARLQHTASFFKRPVYLTETSAGFDDRQKAAWMRGAYEVVRSLRNDGVPVVGINWWPLFETVLWDYRDNSSTVVESIRNENWNNGLYFIREEFDGTLTRVHTAAADAFRDLIASHPNG